MSSSDSIRDSLFDRIYNINEHDFDTVAADLWRFQYNGNILYRDYCNLLGVSSLINAAAAPFLPITMFRDHVVKTGEWEAQTIFRSSGTTGSIRSSHHIRDINWYHQIAYRTFQLEMGVPSEFAWIALLPSYLERGDSSLVDMVHYLMHIDKRPGGKFYSGIDPDLIDALQSLAQKNQKTVLIGVSFALLDLFENYQVPFWEQLIVIETGGMKGRGPEITREELHGRLRRKHPGLRIASEYGMTELQSQAYLTGEHFQPSPAMKVYGRDITDPLSPVSFGQRGTLNFIDLGNIDTCAFIATEDIGIVYQDGTFDVLGRLDQSDIRGCNLLYL